MVYASSKCLKSGWFENWTLLDCLNSVQVRFRDSHCIHKKSRLKNYLEKELVIGIERTKELTKLQMPKANMFKLASTGFPRAV